MDDVLDKATILKNMLVGYATGGSASENEYAPLRRDLMVRPETRDLVPDVVRTCRTLGEFWGFIQPEYATYRERRMFLRDAFDPLLTSLERAPSPAAEPTLASIRELGSGHVEALWSKALARCDPDPEGAITAAKSLVESVCKHILDDLGIKYGSRDDLNELWRKVAQALNLNPAQHDQEVFKGILGSCQNIVNSMASVRNALSDGHGRGRTAPKPSPRHARLVVNLAGTMSAFLIDTATARGR